MELFTAFVVIVVLIGLGFGRALLYVNLAIVGVFGLFMWLMLSAHNAKSDTLPPTAAACQNPNPFLNSWYCPNAPTPTQYGERYAAISACLRRLGVDITHPPADMGPDDGRVRYCNNNWHQEVRPAPAQAERTSPAPTQTERTSGWFYRDDQGDKLGPFPAWKDARADCRSRALAHCDGPARYWTAGQQPYCAPGEFSPATCMEAAAEGLAYFYLTAGPFLTFQEAMADCQATSSWQACYDAMQLRRLDSAPDPARSFAGAVAAGIAAAEAGQPAVAAPAAAPVSQAAAANLPPCKSNFDDLLGIACRMPPAPAPAQAERSSDMYEKALQTLLGETLTPLGN